MTRRALTDEEIAALPREKQLAILRKRRQRSKAAAGETVAREKLPVKIDTDRPAASRPAAVVSINGIPIQPADLLALPTMPRTNADIPDVAGASVGEIEVMASSIYDQVRAQLVAAARWNETAMDGHLWTYAKMTALIRGTPAFALANLPAVVTAAQARAAAALKLMELPPDKVRKADRFGGAW